MSIPHVATSTTSPKAAKSSSASPRLPSLPGSPELDIIAVRDDDDGDSALGDEVTLSTSSVSSSILHYRTIQGRTYHSDRFTDQYFTPNDDRQQESIDIIHHYHTLSLDGKIFVAPIPDTVKKVLDIGTGTGIWAIDFADMYPEAQVIGTDLSPIQPEWVPPNVKFEIDDVLQTWTWGENTFDFIHIRYMIGAISNWNALFEQAYSCITPGGWIESCELDCQYRSDDGTTPPVYVELWELFNQAGQKTGRTFRVLNDDIQRKGLEAAGFINIQEKYVKTPIGDWPADPKLAEMGQFGRLAIESDIDGYTMYLWNNVLGWGETRRQLFTADIRRVVKDRKVHCYVLVKYVWGQKPE